MATDDDALDIRSGGIVAVDTESRGDASARLRLVAGEADGIREALAKASRTLLYAGVAIRTPEDEAADAAARARRLADDLTTMADTYEVAELVAAAEIARASGDAELEGMLRGRALELVGENPVVLSRLAAAALDWRTQNASALSRQFGPGLPAGMTPGLDILAMFATGLVGLLGRGPVPRGERLTGEPAPVVVTPVARGRTSPPTTLVQLVDRIPAGDGRVRVERYTMPDGSARFVTYVAGSAFDGPDDEAWDMASNLQLYEGEHGASYDAVQTALVAAGAQPGDAVDFVGYSQGGMVASLLALQSEYDVALLVTFGDPVQADVPDNTLSVAVRHDDDLVSTLAGGGYAAGVGAEGSFVASRETSGSALTGDGAFGPHGLDAYRDTASLLDGSPDPRMDAVRGRLAPLSEATSVAATVYGASRDAPPRLSASAEGGG